MHSQIHGQCNFQHSITPEYSDMGGFHPVIDETTGKITGYTTTIGGADSVFPFSGDITDLIIGLNKLGFTLSDGATLEEIIAAVQAKSDKFEYNVVAAMCLSNGDLQLRFYMNTELKYSYVYPISTTYATYNTTVFYFQYSGANKYQYNARSSVGFFYASTLDGVQSPATSTYVQPNETKAYFIQKGSYTYLKRADI